MGIRLNTATASAHRPSRPHAIIAELYVYALGVTPAAWPSRCKRRGGGAADRGSEKRYTSKWFA